MRVYGLWAAAAAVAVLGLATGCGSSSTTAQTTTTMTASELASHLQSRLADAGYEIAELTPPAARPVAGQTAPAVPTRSLSVAPKGTAANQASLNAELRALDTRISQNHGTETKQQAAQVDKLRRQLSRTFVVNVNVFRNATDAASHVVDLKSANTDEVQRLAAGWPQPGPVVRYRVVGKVVFESPVQAAASAHGVTYAPFDQAGFEKIVTTANG